MEIGLTAKVKPEIDERETDRQASKLQNKFEEAVSDMPATMDLDGVLEKTAEMKEDVEAMSQSLEEAAEAKMAMADGGASVSGAGANARGGGDNGSMFETVSGLAGLVEAVGGDDSGESRQSSIQRGMTAGMNGMNDRLGGILGRVTGMGARLSEMIGQIGFLGKLLLGGAAVIGIGGLALKFLSGIVQSLASTSPLLSQVVDIFGLAMSLYFRPIATMIGEALLPLAAAALQLAAEFNTVFQEEGIASALGFISIEILRGLAGMVLAVDAMGGLKDIGEGIVFGGDGEFEFVDAVRIALTASILKAGVGKILGKGIINSIPRISAARLLNLLVFPKFGTFLANKLGSTLLKASVTEIVEGAFRQLLARAFGPIVANASFNTLWQAAFATLRSKIPSLGVTAFLSRLIPSISDNAVVSIFGRILPKLGGSALLKKLGLSSVIKLLSGRLAYAIPVVGQIVGIIDLLTMAITALIPGIEMFSPINWLLVQTYNTLKWMLGGLFDLGKQLSQISYNFGLRVGEWMSTLTMPSVDDLQDWFMSNLSPILSLFSMVFPLLGSLAMLGIPLYEMMSSGWSSLMKWLEGAYNTLAELSVEDLITAIENIGGEAADGAVNLAESIGQFAWDEVINELEWGEYLIELAWDTYIELVKWKDYISELAWDTYMDALRWVDYISELAWSSFVDMLQWTSFLDQLSWTRFVNNLPWTRYIDNLRWRSFLDNLRWRSFLNNLSWSSFVGDISWSSFVDILSWSRYLSNLSWSSYLSNLSWTSFVDDISWWAYVDDVDWDDFVPDVDWDDFIPDAPSFDSYASGGVVTSPTVAQIGEGGEPEVVLPFSKISDFVNNVASGQSASGVIPDGHKVPALAQGGIVTSSTLAMIGEGSESEAVLPLSKLKQFMSPMAGSMSGSAGDSVSIDINMEQGENLSASEIANAIQSAIGTQLSNIEASIDELAREIKRNGMVGDIKITADGKVMAEVSESGKDTYKRTREINK